MEVDYLKLSEQYAGFLIAIGGVSITVLALVLSFPNVNPNVNPFLVASLVVATISCFTGAHMMAETAAFISHSRGRVSYSRRRVHPSKGTPSGERLFLLASINTFIAVVLVIFALMLLPIVSDKVDVASFTPISFSAFLFVIFAVLSWMCLSFYRMPAPSKRSPIIKTTVVSIIWLLILLFLIFMKCSLLGWSFIPIIGLTLFSLLRFALTFNNGGKVDDIDIGLFSLAITSTCVSLGVAAIQSLFFK